MRTVPDRGALDLRSGIDPHTFAQHHAGPEPRACCHLRAGPVSPEVTNDLFLAHLAVYDFAARFAPGLRVLDLGCGTGYGSAHLLAAAESLAAERGCTELVAAPHPFLERHGWRAGRRRLGPP